MIQLPNMPEAIAGLPRDSRGYPIPWFVAEQPDGSRDFRVACGKKWVQAVQSGICWVCGGYTNQRRQAFVLGPMCTITKTTSEPGCHPECAEFSAMACPFLTKPKAQRRESGLPGDGYVAGHAIMRNPGVSAIWLCAGATPFSDGRGGYLLRVSNPANVKWFCEGRKASRAEVLESIDTGLPALQSMADAQGDDAVSELRRAVRAGLKFVPAADRYLPSPENYQFLQWLAS